MVHLQHVRHDGKGQIRTECNVARKSKDWNRGSGDSMESQGGERYRRYAGWNVTLEG